MFKSAAQLDPTKPEPGLYVGVSRANYFATAACNHSLLQEIRKSPAHVAAARTEDHAHTDSTRWGTALHIYALERAMDPTAFDRQVKVIEAQTTKAGTKAKKGKDSDKEAAKEYYESAFPDIEAAINNDDLAAIKLAATNIGRHGGANFLRKTKGHCEAMLVWADPSGVICKARFDKIIPRDEGPWYWVDLKTTRSIDADDFERSIRDYWYHTQNAFYRRGWQCAQLPDARSIIIAVENAPPYSVTTFEFRETTQRIADETVNAWLTEWAACEQSGNWPHRVFQEPTQIGLPKWIEKQYEQEAIR
jgi:hypothetical protein